MSNRSYVTAEALESDYTAMQAALEKGGVSQDIAPPELFLNDATFSTWRRRIKGTRMAAWVLFRWSAPGFGPWNEEEERPDGAPYPRSLIQVIDWFDTYEEGAVRQKEMYAETGGKVAIILWPTCIPCILPAGTADFDADTYTHVTNCTKGGDAVTIIRNATYTSASEEGRQVNPYKSGCKMHSHMAVLLEGYRMFHAIQLYMPYLRSQGEAPGTVETQVATLAPLLSRKVFSEGGARPTLGSGGTDAADPYHEERSKTDGVCKLPTGPSACSGPAGKPSKAWGLYSILPDFTVLQDEDTLYKFEIGRRVMYERLMKLNEGWAHNYGGGVHPGHASRALRRVYPEDSMRRPAVIFWPPVCDTYKELKEVQGKTHRVSKDLITTVCGGGPFWSPADYIILENDDGVAEQQMRAMTKDSLKGLSAEEQEEVMAQRDRLVTEITKRGGAYDKAIEAGEDAGVRDVGAPEPQMRGEGKAVPATFSAAAEDMKAAFDVPDEFAM